MSSLLKLCVKRVQIAPSKCIKTLMETGNWRVDAKALALLFFILFQPDSTG